MPRRPKALAHFYVRGDPGTRLATLAPSSPARQFTRKPRTADQAPGLPAESTARARQKRSAFGSDVVENCEAVKAVWFTTVVENVFDLLT